MLPDFPRIKQKWAKVFIKYVKDNVTRASFLSKIKTVPEDIGVRPTQLTKNKQYYRSLGQVSICSKIFHGC